MGFSSVISFVAAALAKTYMDNNLLTAHGALTAGRAIGFLLRTGLASGIAMLLLVFSLLAVRLSKILGERWFP